MQGISRRTVGNWCYWSSNCASSSGLCNSDSKVQATVNWIHTGQG